jgi:Fe-S oxidoreductase
MPARAARRLVVLGYPDVFAAADDVPAIIKARPVGLEGMDDGLVRDAMATGIYPRALELLPPGGGWLLVEFGAETAADAQAQMDAAIADISRRPQPPSLKPFEGEDVEHIWRVRESALGVAARVGADRPTWEGWEDAAVPRERLGEYLRAFRALLETHGYHGNFYGHFGQGCVHTRIDFDLVSEPGIGAFRKFVTEAAALVARLGGSISGEHGDGQARGELLTAMFTPEMLDVFREFKRIWDPAGRMNPGKLVDALPLDRDLRLGADYHPPALTTRFAFPQDRGQFSKAALRCVGVGACRQLDGGTMCPSFMATREEQHSTRGRARLLFEMLEADPLHAPWHEEHVKEALDLCLACKGCKRDCPVSVDMATYKAEFLSHYYEGRPRPRSAYAFGLIRKWARIGSAAPGVVNLAGRLPGVRAVAKWMAGMPQERTIPEFSRQTFRQWFRTRPASPTAGRPVVLWPDTFSDYFAPDIGKAAVRVLERAGWDVRLPPEGLCCGRPLYDYGFLDDAKRQLTEILSGLKTVIDEQVPIVGLEPSCVAVFRDELGNLFPRDAAAQALARQTFLLTEFLAEHAGAWAWLALQGRAIVHVHCHHKAVLDAASDARVLTRLGLDAQVLDSGCCGMAGSFGFEHDHYEVSVRVGERVLLPAVRAAAPDTFIVADGFSCREQIKQTTGRRAWHPIEIVARALDMSH